MSAEAGPPLLTTERLRLRELRPDDFDAVHAYASDIEVVRYMPWGPNTPQDTRDFLARATEAASAEPRVDYQVAVETRSDDRLIGAAGLHVGSEGYVGMLGYCYHPDAWGRGYATEAGLALLGFGFEVLLLDRIWAGCDTENDGSIRVLEKIGMTREGHLRRDTRIRGEPRDSYLYAILAHEWNEGMENG